MDPRASGNQVGAQDDGWVTVSGGDGWETVSGDPRNPMESRLADDLPTWARPAGEFVDSAYNKLMRSFGNVVSLLPGEIGKTGREAASIPAPTTSSGKWGETLGQAMEFAIPIPGLNKVGKLREGAGALERMVRPALQSGIHAGVVGTVDTGSVKEGANQGATAVGLTLGTLGLSKVLSPTLKKSAQKIYERIIIPGGGPLVNKREAKDAAEELIRRGFVASSKDNFVRRVEQNVMDFGQRIEDAENNALQTMGYRPSGRYTTTTKHTPYSEAVPETIDITPSSSGLPARPQDVKPTNALAKPLGPQQDRVRFRTTTERIETMTPPGRLDIRPIIRALSKQIKDLLVEGKVPRGYESQYKALAEMRQEIRRFSNQNEIDVQSAIDLRRKWDAKADWPKLDQEVKEVQKRSFRAAANALRRQIAEHVPGMAEANAEYHFWTGLNTVLKDKELQTVGHREGGLVRNLARGAGGVVGAGLGMQHGGAVEAAAGAYAGQMLLGTIDKLVESTAFKSISAVSMDRLGRLMQNRQYKQALNYLSLITPSLWAERQPKNDQTVH